MRGAPRVTVLMTVYNDEKFLGSAIESVLRQTFKDFELLIIDDGSTDRCGKILRAYAGKDERIRVIKQENQGTTAAANRGLAAARGRYIARLDSDDISFPFRLQTEVDYLDRHPDVALVGGGSEIIDDAGAVIGVRNIAAQSAGKTLRHRCIFQQSDVMFRRDTALKVGGYREKFQNAQDYDLWLRISEVAEVEKLHTVLGQWRLNAGGYTLSRMAEQKKEVRTIKEFARQRRGGGKDGYDGYAAAEKKKHRAHIAPEEYDLLVGFVLLQSARPIEARRKIGTFMSARLTSTALAAYILTFAPRPLIRLLFRARNLYLNNRN
ncbi:MAG: glycosyltransferase [Elusimicrobiota bacterium]